MGNPYTQQMTDVQADIDSLRAALGALGSADGRADALDADLTSLGGAVESTFLVDCTTWHILVPTRNALMDARSSLAAAIARFEARLSELASASAQWDVAEAERVERTREREEARRVR